MSDILLQADDTLLNMEKGGESISKSSVWLDAHYNPVASLYTFSSCIALADLHADGENKLIIADLGTGVYNMKLKVYKGTSLLTESSIIDLPTAVVTFHMDLNEPRTPAVAVASGPYVYIYKNLRPYFKFSLPLGEVNPVESDIWNQAKNDAIDIGMIREMLESLRNELGASVMTVQSLKLLQLPPEELAAFAAIHKHAPLKKQSVVTCMDTLRKYSNEDNSISCLVVGTESKEIIILDPEAFTVLSKVVIPSVPVFLSISGLFDVDYRIMIACRNSKVYHLKKGNDPVKLSLELASPIVGLERIGKNIVIGCMDQTITCCTMKGKKIWAIHLSYPITAMTVLNHKSKGYKLLLAALDNAEVHVYREKVLCDVIKVQDVVSGMKFGKFGREDCSLIMTTKGGGLIVKILKRTANFENIDLSRSGSTIQLAKLNIPRKTKLFVDQALRERECAAEMHSVFQKDLFKLRLTTARSFSACLRTSLNPLSSTVDDPLKLSAKIQGLGPGFKILLTLQNTSPDNPSRNLIITFSSDHTLYKIERSYIEIPLLLPDIIYTFDVFVECISDKGVADKIKAFILRKNNPIPIVTALISMPISEAVVMA